MLDRLFPRVVDNRYRGHWIGFVCLILVVLLKATQGVEVLLNTHDTLIKADGIPVDNFAPDAAATALGIFALLGMYTLLMPVLAFVALVRWRALVPFVLFMLIVVQAGARLVQAAFPIPRAPVEGLGFAGQPIGFWVNLAILAVTILGFGLSLMQRPQAEQSALAREAH